MSAAPLEAGVCGNADAAAGKVFFQTRRAAVDLCCGVGQGVSPVAKLPKNSELRKTSVSKDSLISAGYFFGSEFTRRELAKCSLGRPPFLDRGTLSCEPQKKNTQHETHPNTIRTAEVT